MKTVNFTGDDWLRFLALVGQIESNWVVQMENGNLVRKPISDLEFESLIGISSNGGLAISEHTESKQSCDVSLWAASRCGFQSGQELTPFWSIGNHPTLRRLAMYVTLNKAKAHHILQKPLLLVGNLLDYIAKKIGGHKRTTWPNDTN
jgi:hypothetical protein